MTPSSSHAAAGGVGCIAAQLAALRGATVIGTASERNVDFLRQIGVIPVVHDGDIVVSIKEAAPNGVDAYLDAFGGDNLATAHALRVPPGRIRSVVDWDGVLDYGPNEYGSDEYRAYEYAAEADPDARPVADSEHRVGARGIDVVAKLARLAEQHRLLVPVSDIFPLEQVREAFEELDRGHARGKIVLGMHPVGYAHQHIHEASWQGVPLKESAATVDVPTEHAPMRVRENLPPVLGHLPGQRHPHPSDELAEEH